MKEQLVSFKTAKLAAKKGFNITPRWCYDLTEYYTQGIYGIIEYGTVVGDLELYAPTQSLLQKWLREEHDIHIEISKWDDDTYSAILVSNNEKYNFPEESEDVSYEAIGMNSYEEALEIGLYEALKLIGNGIKIIR